MKIPKTQTGQYQIEYFCDGETYEYCDEGNIEQRVEELESDENVILIEVHEVPPISPPGGVFS